MLVLRLPAATGATIICSQIVHPVLVGVAFQQSTAHGFTSGAAASAMK